MRVKGIVHNREGSCVLVRPSQTQTTNLGVGSSNLPRCATFIFDFSIA